MLMWRLSSKAANSCERGCSCAPVLPLRSRATRDAMSRSPSSDRLILCSLLVLLVLVVLVRSGLPVLVPVLVLVLFVLVLSVLLVPAVVVLTVLAVLVLVDSRLITGAFCAARGSVPTRTSSSSVASMARGAPCWRR